MSALSACQAPGVGVFGGMVSTLMQTLLVAQCGISDPSMWPADYADQAFKKKRTYDFVVVGAGTAGSVMASRLSENPKWRVLVLEAGGDPPQESQVPQMFLTMLNTNFSWNYYTERDDNSCQGFTDQRCFWPRGRFIGGSGGVSDHYYLRGNKGDYDLWAEKGNKKWSWDEVASFFKKAETPAGNATHPIGSLSLEDYTKVYEDIQNMIIDASAELGVPYVDEFGPNKDIGVTNVKGTLGNRQRASTALTYLAKVAGRPNLHVIKHATATKINFNAKGDKVESVTCVVRGQTLTIKLKRELILSAGSIESPKLLMLSGIGPKEHLEKMNIPVIKNLSVGYNLQDHVGALAFTKVQNNEEPMTQQDNLENLFKFLMNQSSPLQTPSTAPLVQMFNTVPGSKSPYPDVQYHNLYVQRGDFDSLDLITDKWGIADIYKPKLKEVLQNYGVMLNVALLLRPSATGRLTLRSANYTDNPILFSNWLSEKSDVDTLVRGLQILSKEIATKAFKSKKVEFIHIPIEECDKFEFMSDEYFACYGKYFGASIFHQVGTVKMGPDSDPDSCVDEELLLRGMKNLRVVDGSIFPTVVSSNTNAAVVMVAERGADFVTRRWYKKRAF